MAGGRITPPDPSDLSQAQEALDDAQNERKKAEQQRGLVSTLRERWNRVHERNNLAALFNDEYGRTT